MPRAVAIVFAPDYAAGLRNLAFRAPVWLADTPENRAAAAEVWQDAVEWPHITVTLFRPPSGAPLADDWRVLLDQIFFQERACDAVEVIGAALTLPAHAVLMESGFSRVDETAEGFRARKATLPG